MIATALMCMALNIYHEARGEPFVGQMAVAQSVLNRMEDKRFPNDVCSVVKQANYRSWDSRNPIRHQCSYSWFCDGKPDTPTDDKVFLESQILAQYMLSGRAPDVIEGATHYHADYVNPYWASSMDVTVKIGKHIYYR